MMVPIGCPEKSVRICHHSLRNNPGERSSRLLRGRRLKSSFKRDLKHDKAQWTFLVSNCWTHSRTLVEWVLKIPTKKDY